MADALTDEELVGVLQRYLTILQGHPPAEKMMRSTRSKSFSGGDSRMAKSPPRPGSTSS
jgi:hypothetical protein